MGRGALDALCRALNAALQQSGVLEYEYDIKRGTCICLLHRALCGQSNLLSFSICMIDDASFLSVSRHSITYLFT